MPGLFCHPEGCNKGINADYKCLASEASPPPETSNIPTQTMFDISGNVAPPPYACSVILRDVIKGLMLNYKCLASEASPPPETPNISTQKMFGVSGNLAPQYACSVILRDVIKVLMLDYKCLAS